MVSSDPNNAREIRHRIIMFWGTLCKHLKVIKSNLHVSLRRKLYSQCILPVMTNGAEICGPTKKLGMKIRPAQGARERIMLGVTLRYRKRATRIKEQTRVYDIIVQINRNKWSWVGHVVR